jgi:hypothetical protein
MLDRHGSTRWLWKDQNVPKAVRYVVRSDAALEIGNRSLTVAAR